jgi:hypothetical protein
MARQITVLETVKASDGVTNVRCVFWYNITSVNARVPKPQFVSALLDVSSPNNVTPAEQTLLESGQTREELVNITLAASTNVAQAKLELQRRYTDRAAAVAAEPATRALYGLTFDGTVWSS